jgi:uncharacterized protein (TIGR00255 family)
MPKKLGFFDASIRNALKPYIQRGKVDVFVTYEDFSEKTSTVRYNKAAAEEYLHYLRRMSEEFSLEDDIRVSTLSRFPEVFTLEEQTVDEDALWALLKEALTQAAESFVQSRIKEGDALYQDLIGKLDLMLEYVDRIEERAPHILEEYRKKLDEKVHELLEDTSIDESRLATEIVLYADKICVDEETVRLRSHIVNTKDVLTEGGSVGRKLDFIAQEMNREANTILSKANDLETSNIAISLKTEIEKVREQIQNLE